MNQNKTARWLPISVTFLMISLIFAYFQNCSQVNFTEKAEVKSVGTDVPSSAGGLDTETPAHEINPLPSGSPNPADSSNPPGVDDDSGFNIGDEGTNPTDPSDPSMPTPPEVVNPFDPNAPSSDMHGSGLKGNLYYLTTEHQSLFANNNLNNAKIDDYRIYGISVPVNIVMTSINVTPRSWDSGFAPEGGNVVQKEDGESLFEWFHVDLLGYVSLPQGSYQFAVVSDDGMRVTIEDQMFIEDDGVHAPRWKCAWQNVTFDGSEKKKIRVQYFQGPRTQIAMQLLVRTAQTNSTCSSSGGYQELPAGSLSH
jgi:hypothetical protein